MAVDRDRVAAAVREILESTRLDPQWLELEITESAFMDDVDIAVNVCRQLKKLGIKNKKEIPQSLVDNSENNLVEE